MHLDPVTRDLTRLIDDIDQNFTRASINNAVVLESFFVEVFLPMFAGDANPPHKVTPEMWMNVARGPFNEVTVVNAANEVLFTVPALCSQEAIKPLDGTRQDAHMPSLSGPLQAASMYAGHGQNAVQNFIARELTSRAFMFRTNTMSQPNIERWNAIFTRYNRPLLPTTATAAAAATSSHADHLSRDSDEFDPL
jgi:hypothetical protein